MKRLIRIVLSVFVVATVLFVLFAGIGVVLFVVTGGSYLPRIVAQVAIYAKACLAWILLASLASLALAFLDEP